MGMMITTVILGALTNLINIGITLYNKGKNRNIYEVKTLVSEGSNAEQVNNLLRSGEYTVLFVGQDYSNTRMVRYVLGRVRK